MLGVALIGTACGGSSAVPSAASPVASVAAPTPNQLTVMAAGDISCDSAAPQMPCRSRETSDLIMGERLLQSPILVLPLGDLQYEIGSLVEFRRSYHSTWGRFAAESRPAVGNHEYETRNATGYFDYFAEQGVSPGDRNEGWYSYDRANWHFVALNSNCARIGGCQVGSPQYRWLQADLLANRQKCTVAYMHHPFSSTGANGSTPALLPLMQLLYENKTEVVLAGHDHNYQRFVPMTPALVPDPAAGFRLFVVGTGGRDLTSFSRAAATIVAHRDNEHYGVLRLGLSDFRYDWGFLDTRGLILDSGTGVCF